jgi:hypothetical protein
LSWLDEGLGKKNSWQAPLSARPLQLTSFQTLEGMGIAPALHPAAAWALTRSTA